MRTLQPARAGKSVLMVALATTALLLVPLVAMQFTTGVNWTALDFSVAGCLLFGSGTAYVLVARTANHIAGRAAACIAVAAALMLIWVNLAVGIIGTEDNPANLMYAGVVGIEIVSASIARLRPRGMSVALLATAIAQALVTVIAFAGGLGATEPPGRLGILVLNGFFIALFAASAWLFRQTGRAQPRPAAA